MSVGGGAGASVGTAGTSVGAGGGAGASVGTTGTSVGAGGGAGTSVGAAGWALSHSRADEAFAALYNVHCVEKPFARTSAPLSGMGCKS